MEHKEKLIKLFSGAFFVAGLVMIAATIFTLGKDKGLTKEKFQVDVYYRHVGGLSEGAPIYLAGVTIGTVGSIDFAENVVEGKSVRVRMNIIQKFKPQLTQADRFVIKTEGILGEKIVEIYLSDQERVTPLDKPITGEDPIDVQDLAIVYARAAEAFAKTSQELSQVNFQMLAGSMNEAAGALHTTAEGINQILVELEDISLKSKRILDRIEQKLIDGNLFKVF